MKRHLTDEEVLDFMGAGEETSPQAREHLRTCPSCRSRIEAEQPLADRLNALPREADPPRDLWPDLRERIEAEPRGRSWLRPALAAAAAVSIFLLGMAVGRAGGPTEVTTGLDGRGPVDPMAAAAEVQRTGTEYVAAVARLRATAAGSGGPVAEQARGAALAAVHGAAWELARMSPGDSTVREIVVLAGDRRIAGEGP